jgi:AcrR family transcriptional regulator
MSRRTRNVKPSRSYDSSRRQEGARQNRARIIDVAELHFLRDGYTATTIATIAAAAGVSADTIYKAFGGKPGLVRAIRDRALEGEGSIPAEQRSDEIHARASDPRKIIKAWGAFVAEITPRVSPILLLIRDAATSDPEVQALREELDAARLERMTRNARRLQDAGHLRPNLTVDEAADVLWTYSSPELYELLVLTRGWSPSRYGQFVADAMISALLH